MEALFETINRPEAAFKRGHPGIAWMLVGATLLMVVLVDPVLNRLVNGQDYPVEINAITILSGFVFGAATYLAVGFGFFGIGRIFGSQTGLRVYLNSWGLTYLPTLLCALTVVLAEAYFYVFWNNTLWGLLLNVVFVGVLIWKTILYVLFLKTVANLTGARLWGAFFLGGIVILLLAWCNLALGLKTPIL